MKQMTSDLLGPGFKPKKSKSVTEHLAVGIDSHFQPSNEHKVKYWQPELKELSGK